MPSDDIPFLAKYKTDTLYTHPGERGVYATFVAEGEELLAEFEVTSRTRVAVSGFYVNDRRDFGSFKIVKITYHKRYGWKEDGSVRVNGFHLTHIQQFSALLASLDLYDVQKARIALGNLQVDAIRTLLSSSKGSEIIRSLSQAPELDSDIYALAAKRIALAEFGEKLHSDATELEWQAFFERNPWVFGHGLRYVFLDKVGPKLEAKTTGASHNRPGKTADGLMRTRAEVSQYVLIEIKKSRTRLLQSDRYRSGCWAASDELSAAVTQSQKTVFEFARDSFREKLKDADGNDTPLDIYAINPRSYLIIGSQTELKGNDDKITCFELYRRNINSPEILTFDELFERARCIVDNISIEKLGGTVDEVS